MTDFTGGFAVALALFLTAINSAVDRAGAVTIDTVPVGNIGNANDPATGDLFGGVDYAYNIGKYEVTVGQYTAFLNAVAGTVRYVGLDEYFDRGISRSGAQGSYVYTATGSINKPIIHVSWGDAARFCNWLHNGQPTGLQDATTTERGAYTLDGAYTNEALIAVSRNAGAKWFIPTENEWYKAAYHQPADQGGDVDNYWDYATRTNIAPYSDQPPGSDAPNQSNTENYAQNDGLANGYNDGYAVSGSPNFDFTKNYLTDVGAYTLSRSHYGTFDQGGNVPEWNEAVLYGSYRGARGGSWAVNDPIGLRPVARGYEFPSNYLAYGFRVASIPEPSALLLGVLMCVGLLLCRRRSVSAARPASCRLSAVAVELCVSAEGQSVFYHEK